MATTPIPDSSIPSADNITIAVTHCEFVGKSRLEFQTTVDDDGAIPIHRIQPVTALRVSIKNCRVDGDGFKLVQHEDGSVDLHIHNALIRS